MAFNDEKLLQNILVDEKYSSLAEFLMKNELQINYIR
jgi:hypothetical protein